MDALHVLQPSIEKWVSILSLHPYQCITPELCKFLLHLPLLSFFFMHKYLHLLSCIRKVPHPLSQTYDNEKLKNNKLPPPSILSWKKDQSSLTTQTWSAYLGSHKFEAANVRLNAPTHVNIMVQPAIFRLFSSLRVPAIIITQ